MSQQENEVTTRFYDIHEAARILHIGEMTLRRRVYKNEIGCYRPSARKMLFSVEQLKEFMERHTHKAKEVEA